MSSSEVDMSDVAGRVHRRSDVHYRSGGQAASQFLSTSRRDSPEYCPMCGGSVWTLESSSPSRDGTDSPRARERGA